MPRKAIIREVITIEAADLVDVEEAEEEASVIEEAVAASAAVEEEAASEIEAVVEASAAEEVAEEEVDILEKELSSN